MHPMTERNEHTEGEIDGMRKNQAKGERKRERLWGLIQISIIAVY